MKNNITCLVIDCAINNQTDKKCNAGDVHLGGGGSQICDTFVQRTKFGPMAKCQAIYCEHLDENTFCVYGFLTMDHRGSCTNFKDKRGEK